MENEIAVRLKAFRTSLGLTQGEFGDKCGISQRTYANLENGKTKKVSSDYLSQIEAAYPKLNPTWLRHGAGEMLRQALPTAPPHFEEIKPGRVLPQMAVASDLDDMSPEALAEYWKMRAEIAESKLAAIEAEKLHQEVVRLVRTAGGRSFNDASPDAADDDYTPPAMVAETNHEYVAAEEQTRRVGFKYGVSLS